ncbi:MAG: type IV secretion system DNA-binding domain-containing protein [Leadbetterella sp.]|nr:type IV secretion system DNA-binding domain-containing protein [Leadbetterella sp.]
MAGLEEVELVVAEPEEEAEQVVAELEGRDKCTNLLYSKNKRMSQLQNHIKHFEGFELVSDSKDLKLSDDSHARCILQGTDSMGNTLSLPLTDSIFSKHLLFLGNIGTGKTNAISQLISQIKSQLKEDDLMIIFDTKGDFYDQFYKDGDIVISNDASKFKGFSDYWNMFSELTIDKTEQSITENALEIASTLFFDRIKKTQQPFFPQAAKDMLATILSIFSINDDKEDLNNEALINYLINTCNTNDLRQLFEEWGHNSINSYIAGDDSPQTGGVLSELYQLLREVFIGDFRKSGNLSIRDLVRKKGGKTIFLEYDISVGNVLTPIYRLLFDLAIKETLSSSKRETPKGNVWFFIDEFSFLPNLKYLDNGVNFGRSQGG